MPLSTQKKKNNNKIIIIALTFAVIVAAYAVTAYVVGIFPFTAKEVRITNEQKTDGASEESTDESEAPDDEQIIPDDTTTPNDTPSGSTPITNPPTESDPFPIENEHYRIDQKSQTQYDITLYPIANNPAESDYTAQLKAYKSEALQYLKSRFGSTENMTFNWSPQNAADI